jgi:hypothetical protein
MAPRILPRIRASVLDPTFLDGMGLDRSRVTDLLQGCESSPRSFARVWSVHVLSLWFHRYQ